METCMIKIQIFEIVFKKFCTRKNNLLLGAERALYNE